MNGLRRYEIIEQSSPFVIKKTFILSPETPPTPIPFYFPPLISDIFDQDVHCSLDFLKPPTCVDFLTHPFDPFVETAVIDLVLSESTPFFSTYKRVQKLYPESRVNDFYLRTLSDRVMKLESKLDHLVLGKKEKEKKKKEKVLDRKYSWTAEIKDGEDKKYKWMTDIKARECGKKKEVVIGERKYKWVAEIKGKNDDKRTYTWKTTVGGSGDEKEGKKEKKEKKHKKKGEKEKEEKACRGTRIVEIEEPNDHGAVVLRQAFAKRVGRASTSGKKKELSPQDAAMMIQMTFRAYLIRRSQALCALRDLAVAKTKLKELRKLFHNLSYRSHVAHDAEERQKFSERIIVLLLTVDSIEGVDVMVRAAKSSMVRELEAMLDLVDPQPAGKSLLRRTFDMPSDEIREDIAEGVAQVVQVLNDETFEAGV